MMFMWSSLEEWLEAYTGDITTPVPDLLRDAFSAGRETVLDTFAAPDTLTLAQPHASPFSPDRLRRESIRHPSPIIEPPLMDGLSAGPVGKESPATMVEEVERGRFTVFPTDSHGSIRGVFLVDVPHDPYIPPLPDAATLERAEKAEAERDVMRAELSAACGYLRNAQLDLKTGAPKATALRTIEGGLKRFEAFLTAAAAPATPERQEIP